MTIEACWKSLRRKLDWISLSFEGKKKRKKTVIRFRRMNSRFFSTLWPLELAVELHILQTCPTGIEISLERTIFYQPCHRYDPSIGSFSFRVWGGGINAKPSSGKFSACFSKRPMTSTQPISSSEKLFVVVGTYWDEMMIFQNYDVKTFGNKQEVLPSENLPTEYFDEIFFVLQRRRFSWNNTVKFSVEYKNLRLWNSSRRKENSSSFSGNSNEEASFGDRWEWVFLSSVSWILNLGAQDINKRADLNSGSSAHGRRQLLGRVMYGVAHPRL